MKTKPFNNLLINIQYKEVSSGTYDDMQMYSGNYVIEFCLDCDIEVKYHSPATYYNPEEFELVQTKLITNIKVSIEDNDTLLPLNKVQEDKLAQALEENLEVIY